MDAAKDVQGVAVFMEFRKPGATTQFILFPDGYDTLGNIVSACYARRTITTATPKKQWRMHALPNNDIKEIHKSGGVLALAQKETIANNRLTGLGPYFDSLTRGWVITNKPILVEVSKKDLDDIRVRKTPNKLMYRINQCKIAMMYPTDPVTV